MVMLREKELFITKTVPFPTLSQFNKVMCVCVCGTRIRYCLPIVPTDIAYRYCLIWRICDISVERDVERGEERRQSVAERKRG